MCDSHLAIGLARKIQALMRSEWQLWDRALRESYLAIGLAMKIRGSRRLTVVRVAVVEPDVAGLVFGVRVGKKDIVLNVVKFAAVGPGVVGFAFGDRFGEKNAGPDVVKLRVGLSVGLSSIGIIFGYVLARKILDPTLSALWWGWASLAWYQ